MQPELIQPKDVTVQTQGGEERAYVISKFPAVAGREIVAKYPLSNLPKIGDYPVSEETMLKLMAYVAVKKTNDKGEDVFIRLGSRALVDNHVPDWESLAKLEILMMEYNCSFFADGRASAFLQGLGAKAMPKITEILTRLLGSLSHPDKQRSMN